LDYLSRHPKACRYRLAPEIEDDEPRSVYLRITDIDLKPVASECSANHLSIRSNQTTFGPYCGFGSMFDYTDTLTVDQFEVPAPKDGNLPEGLFEWTEFKIDASDPLEISFVSGDNDESHYGWRIDWRTSL